MPTFVVSIILEVFIFLTNVIGRISSPFVDRKANVALNIVEQMVNLRTEFFLQGGAKAGYFVLGDNLY